MADAIQTKAHAASSQASARAMTYEEFLNWPGDNHHVEWVNGRIVFMSPITKPREISGRFL